MKLEIPMQEAIRLYLEGQSLRTIGDTFGVNWGTIRKRLLKEGVELRHTFRKPATEQEQVRIFWTRVDKNGPTPKHNPELGPCWIWTGGKDKNGYGVFQVGGERLAHRFAYKLECGPIDKDIFGEKVDIAHACDNPPCVRGSHLFKGMHSENLNEMGKRDRSGRKKFPAEQVVRIRERFAAGETASVLATEYAIALASLWKILRGQSRCYAGGPIVVGNVPHGPKVGTWTPSAEQKIRHSEGLKRAWESRKQVSSDKPR
jgi:hypothetical protein